MKVMMKGEAEEGEEETGVVPSLVVLVAEDEEGTVGVWNNAASSVWLNPHRGSVGVAPPVTLRFCSC